MNIRFTLFAAAAVFVSSCAQQPTTMKDAAKDRFLIGTALNEAQIRGIDTAGVRVVKEHFNAIVAENCMKSQPIHPQRDRYNFDTADRFVEFGLQNGITVTGHTLIWHSQLPRWFVYNDDGTLRSAEELKAIMKEHISTVVGRYKGKVKGWDVVNEAIMEDGSYRRSPFYEILGEEFIPLAFQYAHEADPDAELYYNDYNMWAEGKRNTVVKLIGELRKRGLRIDAVGMQSHMGMDHPDLREYEKSIEAFAAAHTLADSAVSRAYSWYSSLGIWESFSISFNSSRTWAASAFVRSFSLLQASARRITWSLFTAWKYSPDRMPITFPVRLPACSGASVSLSHSNKTSAVLRAMARSRYGFNSSNALLICFCSSLQRFLFSGAARFSDFLSAPHQPILKDHWEQSSTLVAIS